ncbi:MAG TPA: FKBP-type peptidyl-prolyl cis-trans isomerase [Bacteroidia bacterium]|nr:FKBP-type peptidyl-prolyl cis-trans isomerase [Bacteroidia bacterium]
MLRISKIFFIILLVICVACKHSKYKGYSENANGLFYKLQTIGDGKRKPAIGDYLQLVITYKTERDSVFLESKSYNETGMVILPFKHSSFIGSFEEGLTTMNEGDSVSFIVNSDSLFAKFFKTPVPYFLVKDSVVKMEVRLHKILNKEEYAAELDRFNQLVEDRDIEEQRKLLTYLDTNNTKYSMLKNGMYYVPIKQGRGTCACNGDVLKINYKGYFLNGKQFESTYDRGQPLEFTFGEQGQVIKGLETAISLMNEGEKAKFIIPSQLAYGGDGSSTGIIPPYTTVIYEIELVKLN